MRPDHHYRWLTPKTGRIKTRSDQSKCIAFPVYYQRFKSSRPQGRRYLSGGCKPGRRSNISCHPTYRSSFQSSYWSGYPSGYIPFLLSHCRHNKSRFHPGKCPDIGRTWGFNGAHLVVSHLQWILFEESPRSFVLHQS